MKRFLVVLCFFVAFCHISIGGEEDSSSQEDGPKNALKELEKNVSSLWTYINGMHKNVEHDLHQLHQHQIEVKNKLKSMFGIDLEQGDGHMHHMDQGEHKHASNDDHDHNEVHHDDSHHNEHHNEHHHGEDHSSSHHADHHDNHHDGHDTHHDEHHNEHHHGDDHHEHHHGEDHHEHHHGEDHHDEAHHGEDHHDEAHHGDDHHDDHHSHHSEEHHGKTDHGHDNCHTHNATHHDHPRESADGSHNDHDNCGDSHKSENHSDSDHHKHDGHDDDDHSADPASNDTTHATENHHKQHHHQESHHEHHHHHQEQSHHHHHNHGHHHSHHGSGKYSYNYDFADCIVEPNSAIPLEKRQNITGKINLWQKKNGTMLHMHIKIKGFKMDGHTDHEGHQPGEDHSSVQHSHGIHIHQKGDLSNSCQSTGPHFNPTGVQHGGPFSPVRHVGDLGNIECDEDGVTNVVAIDVIASLRGEHSIIGKAIVIHEGKDDFGTNPDNPASLSSGDAGSRIACCVINKIDSPGLSVGHNKHGHSRGGHRHH